MRGRDYAPEKETLSVEVEFADRRVQKGKLLVPAGKSLAEALNGPQAFVEFTPFGDDRASCLAKTSIVAARTIDIPKFVPLHERRGVAGGDDPHQILGVSAGMPWIEIREAYIRLVKAYHPDRYAGVCLPGEVLEYISAKARRINAAYALLEETQAGHLRTCASAANS